MVEGIALAAGSSSRAGCFKMELPLGDKTLIERSIEGMYDVCSRIIVVGGYKCERLREILESDSKIQVVENVNWQSGMFGSIKTGVAAVQSSACFLLPADIPFVPATVYRALLSSGGKFVVPAHNGNYGHPILISSSIISMILNDHTLQSMREVRDRSGFDVVEVDDESVLLDVDTPDDYTCVMCKLQKG